MCSTVCIMTGYVCTHCGVCLGGVGAHQRAFQHHPVLLTLGSLRGLFFDHLYS